MPIAGPTLPDMLATVPPLFASCVSNGEDLMTTVKVLRLVSKALSDTMVTAVTRLSVHVGDWCHLLSAQQVVLLANKAALRSLAIDLTTTSGAVDMLLREIQPVHHS